MEPTSLVSLSGSLMSLFGLLVSLYSVHLGNWLSKLQALRAKWETNSGSADTSKAARRECRYAFVELYNWQPFVMTIIIVAFGLSVLFFFNHVRTTTGVEFPSIFVWVYNSFFGIMTVLSAILLGSGWFVGQELKGKIAAEFPRPVSPSAAK